MNVHEIRIGWKVHGHFKIGVEVVFDGFDFIPGGIAVRMGDTDMYLFRIAIKTENDIETVVDPIGCKKPGFYLVEDVYQDEGGF